MRDDGDGAERGGAVEAIWMMMMMMMMNPTPVAVKAVFSFCFCVVFLVRRRVSK